MKFFVTGGAGFIGSAVIRHLVGKTEHEVLNFDKLTYAENLENIKTVSGNPRYSFIQGDICDRELLKKIISQNKIINLAAESHVY